MIINKTAKLNFRALADICARGARVHFKKASVEKVGDSFVMRGPSGEHRLDVNDTDLDRLNAHWVAFATNQLNA